MRVWIAKYCPCIHESSYGIISVHKTKRGAEMAMEFHKEQERKEWEDMELESSFGEHEDWRVDEYEILI